MRAEVAMSGVAGERRQVRFSYLIATRKCAKFLDKALDNVREPITREDELVITEGASADNAAQVAKRHGDIVSLFRSEPDRGEAVGRDCLVLYGSTGSNYGALEQEVCTEETPLRPASLYGKTRTAAEQYPMENRNAVACRFGAAFGLSPRLRLDLLVNDFV